MAQRSARARGKREGILERHDWLIAIGTMVKVCTQLEVACFACTGKLSPAHGRSRSLMLYTLNRARAAPPRGALKGDQRCSPMMASR